MKQGSDHSIRASSFLLYFCRTGHGRGGTDRLLAILIRLIEEEEEEEEEEEGGGSSRRPSFLSFLQFSANEVEKRLLALRRFQVSNSNGRRTKRC